MGGVPQGLLKQRFKLLRYMEEKVQLGEGSVSNAAVGYGWHFNGHHGQWMKNQESVADG